MTAPTRSSASRREFLTQAGILAVGFTLAPRLVRGESLGPAPRALVPPDGGQLDSWLVIGRDEQITVYAGKVELGTGVSTALRQIVAEELDVPVARIAWVQGDSQLTVDQGRTVGSGSVKRGGAQLRSAAATARQALVELASAKLGVPPERLVVADGVISWNAVGIGQVTLSRRRLITHVFLHEVRHLAQLAGAARAAGIAPPGNHDLFLFEAFD